MTSALDGVGGQRQSPAAFTSGKDAVPIVQEAGWASGPVWTGAENLAPTGIRSPDRPARSESLSRPLTQPVAAQLSCDTESTRLFFKPVKHFKNSQQIKYAKDHGNSYADRERNSSSFLLGKVHGHSYPDLSLE
jgi:hypothetical protein